MPLPPPLPVRAPQRQAGHGCSQSLTHSVADTSASSIGREWAREHGSHDPRESLAGRSWDPCKPRAAWLPYPLTTEPPLQTTCPHILSRVLRSGASLSAEHPTLFPGLIPSPCVSPAEPY